MDRAIAPTKSTEIVEKNCKLFKLLYCIFIFAPINTFFLYIKANILLSIFFCYKIC